MQECTMKFGSWTYNSLQMNLSKHDPEPDLSELIPNEQWDLKYAETRRHSVSYICCPEEYLDVTFYFGLKRKPLYYIYNLLMPCMLLSALSLLGFFMPYDVGVVKVSLSITLILSLTVFLLLVAEMMPRTSEDVPLIGNIHKSYVTFTSGVFRFFFFFIMHFTQVDYGLLLVQSHPAIRTSFSPAMAPTSMRSNDLRLSKRAWLVCIGRKMCVPYRVNFRGVCVQLL